MTRWPTGHVGVDLETGQRVLLPEQICWSTKTFLSAVALRERDDPRIPAALAVRPVVLACPTAWSVGGEPKLSPSLGLTVAEAVDVALELVELAAIGGSAAP